MAQGALVNTEALAAFRVALVKFQENCSAAIGDAESDVHRTLSWLENDQFSYWSTQIRHRQEALARAQESLRQKKLFKDSTGRQPSAVEEQKAVTKAQNQLAEAEQKMAATKMWSKRLQKEMIMYKGQVQRFVTTVTSDIPAAISHIGALINTLEEYIAAGTAKDTELPPELAAYFGGPGGEGVMSRGKSGAAAIKPFVHLRKLTPSAAARTPIQTAAQPPATWSIPSLAEEPLGKLPVTYSEPLPTDRVVFVKDSPESHEIFMERIPGALAGDSGWFIGRLIQKDPNAVAMTIADLLAVRPDLRNLLSLPPGWLVAIEQTGIVGVLNERDENLWPPEGEQPKEEKAA